MLKDDKLKLLPHEFQLMRSQLLADLKSLKKSTCDFLRETPQICVFMNFSRTEVKLWVNSEGYFKNGAKAYKTKTLTDFFYIENVTGLLGSPDFFFFM
jgi:hypothetical protein